MIKCKNFHFSESLMSDLFLLIIYDETASIVNGMVAPIPCATVGG